MLRHKIGWQSDAIGVVPFQIFRRHTSGVMGSGECCVQKKRLIIRASAFYKAYRCVGKYFGSMNTPKNILARKRIHLIAVPVIPNNRAAIRINRVMLIMV
jgi:hypothetical protein